ncbi:MAG: GDP-mannose 4,6-dehydratase [Vulcanimicrobiaceae bacterium]
MRALVTGAGGFVGRYLIEALRARGDDVLACGGPSDAGDYTRIDLRDIDTLRAALDRAKPDIVFHLAAQAFVPESIAAPLETYETNTLGTARLAEAIRSYAQARNAMPRLVFTSSAEVYGKRDTGDFPLRETLATNPDNPYAASKAAAESILLGEVRGFGLDAVIARSFNHIGPGQSDRFVVASFAAQLARIAQGGDRILLVGNLEAKRDFLDVRDVVAAYLALAETGASGEIYNVCSGVARSIRDALRELIIAARIPVEVREDPERMRPSDVPLFVGDSSKLHKATGWEPRVPFTQSIREIYAAAAGNMQSPS